MTRSKQLVALLLLAASAASASAALLGSLNATLAMAAAAADDEEGVSYQQSSHYVTDYTNSSPIKGKFVQSAYATCPAPYDTFSFVTKIRVCKDDDGFITGLKTFSDHPTRHHDPTTVCDVVGRAAHCETIKLYDEDYKWRKYNVITNVRVAKAKDTAGRWRVVYIAFTFSNGDAVEFGKYPDKHGVSEKHGGKEKKHDLKFEQWFQKPNPGQICGMNGMTSSASVCDAKSGYLQWVKPCGKCIKKPKNYKCGFDVCAKRWKRAYKGGGDMADKLYPEIQKAKDELAEKRSAASKSKEQQRPEEDEELDIYEAAEAEQQHQPQ